MITRFAPVLSLGLTNATYLSAGAVHGLAITAAGVVAWGHNRSGQLGDGTTVDRSSPVAVEGLTGAVSVAAGNAFSLSLLSDGRVLAWGNNASGQLGDGSAPTDHTTPVQVAGLGRGSGVIAIAAGGAFSLALRANGSVVAWGNNASGQVGDGSAPTDRPTPISVVGLGAGAGVVKIVAGGTTSYALRSDGRVLAWGNNGAGELGDGNAPTDQHRPVVVPALSGVVDIAAGDFHALAVTNTGAVVAWGENALGQLGDGSTTRRTTPVPVIGLGAGSGVVEVYAGGNHSHALARAASPGGPAAGGSSGSDAGRAPAAGAITARPGLTG